ncbi:aldolase [Burkholderia ubonensis]|uniref:HpcH/HpaI aldolase/citrate lyase family protein n=1 Tax=Burkholderia ubonensis TaxID=101571 RepID=UPI0007570240|nr:aldolase/citrate lyase family protein [Burkholderia ubonensis]KVM21147.1 aldolase [Burkholderia ubonensis]KVM23527.1 aldolase [Burkholderia ubonensis]KVM47882.1 aldolase [Burkholderia ubonensis]KVX42433.1 aldolase [Burkholderia ubonensis]KVX94269.1 aldolase [Burkholderia ubonensis]
MSALTPAEVLYDGASPPAILPCCDHYAGSEKLMRKSLALQAEMGPVFDITLDCEDGAAVGREAAHAELVAGLLGSADNRFGRVGARIHDFSHPHWRDDVRIILRAARAPAYITLPKIASAADAAEMCAFIEGTRRELGIARPIPVDVLVETHGALAHAAALATLPLVGTLSFGLMDFVSAHHGAIPDGAMRSPGQFEHPLVRRAKLEIAAACHAHGKTPSHNVTTEVRDMSVVANDARRARDEFAYTRMWSIHPSQIRPIVDAFAPRTDEVALAAEILLAAQAADWGPTRHGDTLHDRASYRYYWSVLRRARAAGQPVPAEAAPLFGPAAAADAP